MQQLTEEGRRLVDGVAQRHGFSSDAVTTMLIAVSAGYGNQAQFNHPEFGGMGQWSNGGMIMIGDMFNNYLKGRVGSLCQELATLIQGQPMFVMPQQSQTQSQGGGYGSQQQGGGSQQQQGGGYQSQGGYQQQQSGGGTGGSGSSFFVPDPRSAPWWPADLGSPGSTGAQNNLRYAYFPNARRLALDVNGTVTLYDTGNHQIGGFSQQQSGDQSITFTSQFGTVRVFDLPLIPPARTQSPPSAAPSGNTAGNAPAPPFNPAPMPQGAPVSAPPVIARSGTHASPDDIFPLIEKLADLHKKGIITDSEYETKKADLLGRL